jgi:hypothetical protein
LAKLKKAVRKNGLFCFYSLLPKRE